MEQAMHIDWYRIQRMVHQYNEAKATMEAVGNSVRFAMAAFAQQHETFANLGEAAIWLSMQPFKVLGFTIPAELLPAIEADAMVAQDIYNRKMLA